MSSFKKMVSKNFIPALRFHLFTPLYDTCSRLFFGRIFHKIADIVAPKPHEKILDLGCGPGNLIIALKKKEPLTEVAGLDIDPEILKIAARKFKKVHFEIKLIEASATAIESHEHYDKVVSTLMIHHVTSEDKKRMVHEVYRILKSGGLFFLYDFGPPQSFFSKILAQFYRLFEEIDDGIRGNYRKFLEEAGFKNIRSRYRSTMFELLMGEK